MYLLTILLCLALGFVLGLCFDSVAVRVLAIASPVMHLWRVVKGVASKLKGHR
ncbi:hypothetical protein [Caldimonas brevitalea]|uniref:Uncharacterized protein n=1 Tax=Caldimonas brevitalea TaxID=413882 RepID=A0A0G3BQL2_9BURK|nr:hypothetical protein [Caldimonas brevitalea]AKJ28795.1 hypothetical protein AAW51_2104 [Caldimonas brevitalea]